MTNYKGFLIDQTPEASQVMSFNGQMQIGTGTYTTNWVTRIIDPTTAKQLKVKNIAEAEHLIDTWFTGDGLIKLTSLIAEVEEAKKTVVQLQTSTEAQIEALKVILETEKQKLAALKASMPPEFS